MLHEPRNIGGFYGGGGGDLAGAAAAGVNVSFWTNAAAVCRRSIVAAHPHLAADRAVVANMGDDKAAAAERVVAACGDVAIASGGPPCHGMSPMNKKNHEKKKYIDMNNHASFDTLTRRSASTHEPSCSRTPRRSPRMPNSDGCWQKQ